MLGYTGEFEGAPVSVQATGMGCPSAAIVMEELVQLGVKRFLRVGTCGGLQHDLQLGDLIVAVSAGHSGPPISPGCETTMTASSPASLNSSFPRAKPCS